MKPHPFKGIWTVKIPIPEKPQLRKDIISATKEYLKNHTIEYIPYSPSAKVPSVRVRELGAISDAEEFYYLEEQFETNLY